MERQLQVAVDARLLAVRQGGIGTYTDELLAAMSAARETKVTAVIPRLDRSPRSDWQEIRRISAVTPPHHRLERYALAAEIGWRAFDVFHSPDFIPPIWTRGRRVITIHDLAFLRFPDFITRESRRYYNDHVRWAVDIAHRIICVSAATRADVIELLGVPADRIDVIHEAPRAYFRRGGPIGNLLHGLVGIPFVLFVGTVEPRKNLNTLIRAIGALHKDGRRAPSLVVAGALGWLAEDTVRLPAKLGVADRVSFLGACSQEELQALYNQALCLALPSHAEGFGLPIVEAMVCGAPVITSDIPVFREVAGDAAIYVPTEDHLGFADAILRLMDDDDLRAQHRERGYQRVARYSWVTAARETVATYHRALM